MHEIELEIEQAVSTLPLPPDAFIRCDPETAADVVARAKERFVEGNPRAWWLALRCPADVVEYADASGPDHLLEYVPEHEARCWFVAETESDPLPVYNVDPKVIADVLRECRFFEYYVLGRQLTWLIAENDHNQLVIARIGQAKQHALHAAGA